MLGYSSYIDKGINGIKTISDGFTVIQNGNIDTNNISTGQIDTSHINSSTGQFDTFDINTLTTGEIHASTVYAESGQFDTFDIDTVQVNDISASDMNVLNINASTVYTESGQFETFDINTVNVNDISANDINVTNVNSSVVDISELNSSYINTSNINTTGINTYTMNATTTNTNTLTASSSVTTNIVTANTFIKTGDSPIMDQNYCTGNFKNGVNINPHLYCVNGDTSTNPVSYGGLHLPYTDGRNYFPSDSYFAGIVATSLPPSGNDHLTNKLYVDNAIAEIDFSKYAVLSNNNTFTGTK